MKRRLSVQYGLIIFFAFLAYAIGSALLVSDNLRKVTEHNLNQYLLMVKSDFTSGLSESEIIAKYVATNQTLRITIMQSDGTVVADSAGVVTENHLTRPEFQNLGETFVRNSDTLHKQAMYLATQIDADTYLRVAIPLESILPFLNDFIGLSIVVGAVIVALAIAGVILLADRNMKPLRDIRQSLEDVVAGNYSDLMPMDKDEDVNRIISEINDISKLIYETIQSLGEEKRKTDFINNQMNNGLCVLDEKGGIIIINRFVTDLFKHRDEASYSRDYLYRFRDKSVQNAIQKVYQSHTPATTFFEVDGKNYSLYATYLDQNWAGRPSVLLLFHDVSALKELEITKRDFFVNASHELKSPLTSIIGASELISSGMSQKPAEVADLANLILAEANRMNALVMDMLSLSKYENVMIVKGEKLINLPEVAVAVKNSLSAEAEKRNITIQTDLETVLIQGDAEHFTELIRNLVDNSIKYGVDKGFVQIRISKKDHYAILEVSDNGIGIPKADQTRVFERFYRVDKARNKNTGGTGLGLSIVKHIAMLYNGLIELESTVGKGTKVTVSLPLEP